MVSTDDIISIGVLGLTIGIAAKTFQLCSKPIKKVSNNIWGF